MPSWPAGLPERPLVDGFSREAASNVQRTQMDVGLAKQRRRSTSGARPLKCTILVTDAQYATFQTFFDTTLGSGAIPFDWVDFFTGSAASYRFVHPQPWTEQPRNAGATRRRLALNLEQLP